MIGSLIRFLLRLAALGFAGWGLGAVWFQFESPWSWALCAGVILFFGLVFHLSRAHLIRSFLLFAACVIACLSWWSTIVPSNTRQWAADVSKGVTADFTGDTVVIHNIRDFDWQTPRVFTATWETGEYNLQTLVSVDLVTSTWGMPAIAHTMLSFGFADGRHLVFSAEVRRESDEEFSELGGFFRQFELVLIAAEERDIIRLRTNVRGENVSLFPLRVTTKQARDLLVSYLRKGNQLSHTPEYYQTLTTNCTTTIFKLARMTEPAIPIDWRILVSGYLPDYLYDHHALLADGPLAEIKRKAAISDKAQQTTRDNFSHMIRQSGP